MRAALAGLGLLVVAGCGFNVAYRASRPCGASEVSVLNEEEGVYVLIGEERVGPYDAVSLPSILQSPDGERVGYVAERDGGARVYVDGVAVSPAWGAIGELRWEPSSQGVVYSAEREGAWHVVGRGTVSRGYGAIPRGSLVLDSEGGGFAFLGLDERGAFVVDDGVERGPYAAAGGLSRVGGHLAYASAGRDGAYVHGDGSRWGPFVDVAEVVATSLGRVVATVLTDEGWRVLDDGQLGEPWTAVGSLKVGAGGARLAYAAAREVAGVEQWFVDLDGALTGPYEEVAHDALVFGDGGRALAYHAKLGGVRRVFVEGVPVGPGFGDVGLLAVSAGSRVVGFVGESERGASVVVNGVERGRFDAVHGLAVGGDGHFVAHAELAGAELLLVDGEPRSFTTVIDGSLAMTPDGRRWSALVGDGDERALWYVVDGARTSRVGLDELPRLSPAARSRAELDRGCQVARSAGGSR